MNDEQRRSSEKRWWNRDLLEVRSFRIVALIVCVGLLMVLEYSWSALVGPVAVVVFVVLLKIVFSLRDERVEQRRRADELGRLASGEDHRHTRAKRR